MVEHTVRHVLMVVYDFILANPFERRQSKFLQLHRHSLCYNKSNKVSTFSDIVARITVYTP
ncbi:MAG: hypothetical protein LBT23_12090, partial [Synergistaceae bacterium]|nr:hypothetical protein [Synergistaceae bacterium]